MRRRFPLPPPRSELLGLELHEMVRDFPETLTVLRGHGVDLRSLGTRPLAEVADLVGSDGPGAAEGEALVDDLLASVSWRRGD